MPTCVLALFLRGELFTAMRRLDDYPPCSWSTIGKQQGGMQEVRMENSIINHEKRQVTNGVHPEDFMASVQECMR